MTQESEGPNCLNIHISHKRGANPFAPLTKAMLFFYYLNTSILFPSQVGCICCSWCLQSSYLESISGWSLYVSGVSVLLRSSYTPWGMHFSPFLPPSLLPTSPSPFFPSSIPPTPHFHLTKILCCLVISERQNLFPNKENPRYSFPQFPEGHIDPIWAN